MFIQAAILSCWSFLLLQSVQQRFAGSTVYAVQLKVI